jgi:fibronectin type 3 domain-containing protein
VLRPFHHGTTESRTRIRPRAIAAAAVGLAVAAAGAVGVPAAAAEQTDLLFDFQCAGNPVAPGYAEVAPGTTYDASRGYGLSTALASNACRDRGTGDPEDRDFLLPTSSNRFVADVPDGTYTLVLHTGDAIASSNTGMVANGVVLNNASQGAGTVAERTLESVPVTGGRLEVQFTGSSIRANALEVLAPVAAPTGVAATAHATESPSVDVTWNEAEDATGYRVYRADDGGEPSRVADLPAGTTAWTDTDVALAHSYDYTVTAVGSTGRESQPSEKASVTVADPDVAPPATPSGLTADGTTLSWQAVDGAVAYDVYRARAGGFEPVLVSRVTGTTWTDDTAEPTVSYVYQVASVGTGGRSERSAPVSVPAAVQLERQAERIDRAPVAVATDGGVYVGWRMLGNDPDTIAFHVYRDGKRITDKPVTGSTNLVDPDGTAGATYRVSTVVGKNERWATGEFAVQEAQTLDVPLQRPDGGTTPDGVAYTYRANDASVGDVDGDGQYEIVLKWDPTNSQDNSRAGYTGNVYVDAYELDGTLLWRIDLGKNIRAGAHYTQFQVFDYDGNGKAEVMMKTADGTVDGQGTVIGNAAADHRNSSGYVLAGPEFLTVFDGATGAAVDTVDYVPARGNVGSWGDTYGNRVDRFLAGTAYLDGERPSAIFARGYYTRAVVAAFDFDGENLTQRWVFDSNDAGSQYQGQGNHSLAVADVDGDQKDEIVYGSMTLDDDGSPLYNTGLGHGDAQHVSDFDPARPGLEVFSAHESMSSSGNRGATYRDAETGEIIWDIPAARDTGRAAMADIDPRHDGSEGWAVGGDAAWNSPVGQLKSASGELIAESIPAANFLTFWDGDLLREIGDHDFDAAAGAGVPTIAKWDWEAAKEVEIYRAEGTLTSNGTKGNVALQADLLGDWREEIVTRTEDSSALRIATTVIPTEHRLRTLMSDSQYRLAVAWQNTGYNQPPHTSYFIGAGMEKPEAPRLAYTADPQLGEPVSGRGGR